MQINYRSLLFMITTVISSIMDAQTIDQSRRTDWTQTGVEGEVPCWSNVVNFLSNGGVADGATDNTAALQNLMNTYAGTNTVIYLDAGEYRFNSYLSIPRAGHLVIRGAGADQTKLYFNNADMGFKGDFEITGGYGESEGIVTQDVQKGDFTIEVGDASNYAIGDWLEIEKDNDATKMYTSPDWDVDWAAKSVGQILRIMAINGNTITVNRELRSDYELSLNPVVRKIVMTEYVGFENFYIENLVDGDHYQFHFKRTSNTWVRGVHGHMTSKMYVYVSSSIYNEVIGCYFYDSFRHDGGGHGYGVVHGHHVSDCLTENNVFRRLRHSLMSKQGANGNVMAYNYSFEYHADFSSVPTDISLHGHWPHMNLYEGNIMNRCGSGDFWGPSGPGNTFFRNRFVLADIYMHDASHDQNVVGNEMVAESLLIDPSVDGTFVHGNNNLGTITWDDNAGKYNVSNSYYLSSKPSWWGSSAWPSIGPEFDLGSGSNPAFDRVVNANGDESQYVVSFDCGAPTCQTPYLGVDESICGQSTIMLDAGVFNDGVSTFEWFLNGDSQGTPTVSSVNFEATEAGEWMVKVDSLGICSSEDIIIISNEIAPFELDADIELCDDVDKEVVAGVYNPNYTYSWTLDHETIDCDTSSYIVNSSGELTVVVSALGCDDVERGVTVQSFLPQVQGDLLCDEGTAELSASGLGDLFWFDDAVSKNVLETGNTYSPSISASETFYVEDQRSNQYEAGRLEMVSQWDGADYADRKIRFTLEKIATIDAVTVRAKASQTVHVRILAEDNSTVLVDSSIVAEGVQEIALGVTLDPGTYYMDAFGSTGTLMYENESADPQVDYSSYTIPGVISFLSEPAFESSSLPRWRYFYNWKITTDATCSRVPVSAIVDPSAEECQVLNNEELDELSLSPNPSSGIIYFSEVTSFTVYDLLGAEVLSGTSSVIDLSSFVDGVYVMKTDNKTIRVVKE